MITTLLMSHGFPIRFAILIACGLSLCGNSWCGPARLAAEEPLDRITAGTVIDRSADESVKRDRWNHVILLATPRITSGDTNKLSDTIRKSVSTLTLTILGTIKQDDNGVHQLLEAGVGYSVPIDGKQTVITSESASRLGARLGLIANQMLRENESRLQQVVKIAQTSTLCMFDAPAILVRGGVHRDYIVRHLVWIDPMTGKAATLVWLLSEDPTGVKRVVNEPARFVSSRTVEDRRIHVDGSQFLFGIPNERAFALEELPPGVSIPWGESTSPLASQNSYTQQELTELAGYLNRAIAAAKASE